MVGTNSVAATGGVDAEPIELARQRAADALGRPDRTVTTDDAVALAVTTPGVGVARAHASPGYHPGFPCVEIPSALTVTVVPEVDRDSDVAEWTLAPEPDGDCSTRCNGASPRGDCSGRRCSSCRRGIARSRPSG